MTIRFLKSINKKRRRGDKLSLTVTDGACSQQRQDQAGGPRGPAERPGFQAALRVPPGKKDDSDRQHRALPEERYVLASERRPGSLSAVPRHGPGAGLACSSRGQERTLSSSKPDSPSSVLSVWLQPGVIVLSYQTRGAAVMGSRGAGNRVRCH